MPPEAEDATLSDVAALIRAPAPKAPPAAPAAQQEAPADDDLLGEDDTLDLAAEAAKEGEQPEEQTTEEDQTEEEPEEQTEEEDVDIDEIPIEVTVDGETKEVPLKELKANYSGEKAIEKRLQEATEVRQQVYMQGQTLYQALGAVSQKLQHLDQIIAQTAEPEIDWDTLRATDPARYLLERDKHQIAQQKRQQLYVQSQQAEYERAELARQYAIEQAKEQASNLLKDFPELRDPEKGPKTMKAWVETAAKYGFDFEEVRQVMDSRQLKVLARLAELETKAAAAPKPVPKAPRPLSKPGSAPAARPMSELKKMQLSALKRARTSGKVDDVAALLLTPRR
jgi:flagellar motor switch/type III secretory pathway protein FliN